MNENKRVGNKFYFSFEIRILLMLVLMLFLFFLGCFFVSKAFSFTKGDVVTYDESSDIHYEVCLKQNDHYQDACLDEGMQYISDLTHNIYITFLYNVKISTEISYQLGYHLSGITKIYDSNNPRKIFYKNEEKLLNSVDISDDSDKIDIEQSFVFDYARYNKMVQEYRDMYVLADASSEYELILYLEEENETRKVASVTIPLGTSTYGVSKDVLSNMNRDVQLYNRGWNPNTVFYILVSSVLIITSLIFLYHITRLVLKVTNNKSKYQKYLSQILKEYDSCIVNSKEGYKYPKDKQVIKVASFEELVDAKNILKKPIIYSKINDVKSEFVVEDDDKLFIYILKESDL